MARNDDRYNEVINPAGRPIVREHMRAMLKIGEQHPNIRKLLNDLAALGEKMKAAGETSRPAADSSRCPRCDFPLR